MGQYSEKKAWKAYLETPEGENHYRKPPKELYMPIGWDNQEEIKK
jgi:hypothetical protein